MQLDFISIALLSANTYAYVGELSYCINNFLDGYYGNAFSI